MLVGIDIENVSRFLDYKEAKDKIDKIFTVKEQEYFAKFKNSAPHIAGTFCAKEAVSKALKVGFYNGLTPLDIEILHGIKGEPYVNIEGKIEKLLKGRKVDISISHSKDSAIAICIINE